MQQPVEKKVDFRGNLTMLNQLSDELAFGNYESTIYFFNNEVADCDFRENNYPATLGAQIVVYCVDLGLSPTPLEQYLIDIKTHYYPAIKFLVTKAELTPLQKALVKEKEIACFNLDDTKGLISALGTCLQDIFFLVNPAEIVHKSEKVFKCIPDLTGKKLADAAWIALNDWVTASIRNRKSIAEQRLDLFSSVNNDNCHALLAQFLYGKGDYGLNSLKHLLFSQLMASTAKNNNASKYEIELVRNALRVFLCNELQHIEVQYEKNGETVVMFLDKRKITKESVMEAYTTYALYSGEKMPIINGDNYRMGFRQLVCNFNRYYTSPVIAKIFEIPGEDTMELIYWQLYNHLLHQDISDPYADIHVLTPAYWQLVCQELESVCKHSMDQEILAKIKKDMIVLNEPDAEWLYFPQNRVCRKLKNIREIANVRSTPYSDISKVNFTLRLLDVLRNKSIMLDEKSLRNLRKQEKRFKALYENACMNNLDNFVAQLKPYLGAIQPCMQGEGLRYDGHPRYSDVFKQDNPKKLCLYLDSNLCKADELRDWFDQANVFHHTKIMQLLITDGMIGSESIHTNMLLACQRRNFDSMKLLAPLKSWSFQDISNHLAGFMEPDNMEHLQIELAFILTICKGLILRDEKSFNAINLTSNHTLQQEITIMAHKVAINRYAFFASQLPLPQELKLHVMNDLACLLDCSEITKNEVKAAMPITKPEKTQSILWGC